MKTATYALPLTSLQAVVSVYTLDAHVHGAAGLDVAVDNKTVTLELDSPLDRLLGIERAPRTASERRRANEMVAKLKAAGNLFKIDSAAKCTLASVELNSAVLKLGKPEAKAPEAKVDDGEHADLTGRFEFSCEEAPRAAFMDVRLFDAFPLLQRIEVQVATAKGQFKADLKRPARRIALSKPGP